MARFGEVQARLAANADITRLAATEVDELKRQYPEIPEDYLAFLAEVGFGDLGELQLHSGPSSAGSLYSPLPKHLEQVIVFGDDKQGYCFGFDRANNYRLVEVSPNGEVNDHVDPNFTKLLHGYFR